MKPTRHRFGLIAAAAAVCVAAPITSSLAQEGTAGEEKKERPGGEQKEKGNEKEASDEAQVLYEVAPETSVFAFDYGPPTSPATSLLGLSSGAGTTSTSLTEFVLSLPNVLGDEEGQSIALDFPPAALFQRRSRWSFDRYVAPENRVYRLLHRTRFTAGLLNGSAGDDNAANSVRSAAAIGLSMSLLDSADPLVTGRDATGRSILQRCLLALHPRIQAVQRAVEPTAERQALENEDAVLADAARLLNDNNPTEARTRLREFYENRAGRAPAGEGAERAAPSTPASAPASVPAPASTRPRTDAEPADRLALIRVIVARLRATPNRSPEDTQLLTLLDLEISRLDAGSREPPRPQSAQQGSPAGTTPERPRRTQDDNRAAAEVPEVPEDADALKAFVAQQRQRIGAERTNLSDTRARTVTQRLQTAGLTAQVSRCSDLANRTARFSTDLDLGFGLIARGRPGELADLDAQGGAIWAAFRQPLHVSYPSEDDEDADATLPTSALMITASGRFGLDERLATGDATVPEFRANTLDAWLGLEYLNPRFRLAGQYGWRRTSARTDVGEQFESTGGRYLVQGQFRLGGERSPFWLGLSYGSASGTRADLNDDIVLVTVSVTPPKPPNLTRGD